MNTLTWDQIRETIGGELALYAAFMASLEASNIVDGFMKMSKGARYVSQETIDALYYDISQGILKETLENKIDPSILDVDRLDRKALEDGLDQANDWAEGSDDSLGSSYLRYLTRWDLEGHSWTAEKPQSYTGFLGIQA